MNSLVSLWVGKVNLEMPWTVLPPFDIQVGGFHGCPLFTQPPPIVYENQHHAPERILEAFRGMNQGMRGRLVSFIETENGEICLSVKVRI
jgi:hypothetical protein